MSRSRSRFNPESDNQFNPYGGSSISRSNYSSNPNRGRNNLRPDNRYHNPPWWYNNPPWWYYRPPYWYLGANRFF